MQFTNPASSTTTVLSPGSAVSIVGTVPVDASGTTVPTSVAAANSGTPTAGPSFAIRSVTQLNDVVTSVDRSGLSTGGTSTVIAGSANAIELHLLIFTFTWAWTGGLVIVYPVTATLVRSDTGANLMAPMQFNSNAGGSTTLNKDFAGVTLPTGVAVNLVITIASSGSGTHTGTCVVNIDLGYNLV